MYTWKQIDVDGMTNLFLYGQITTPSNLVDASLIRDNASKMPIVMDAVSFMASEEGQCRHYDTAWPVTPLTPCATVGTDPAAPAARAAARAHLAAWFDTTSLKMMLLLTLVLGLGVGNMAHAEAHEAPVVIQKNNGVQSIAGERSSTAEIIATMRAPTTPQELMKNLIVLMDQHLLSRADFYNEEKVNKLFGAKTITLKTKNLIEMNEFALELDSAKSTHANGGLVRGNGKILRGEGRRLSGRLWLSVGKDAFPDCESVAKLLKLTCGPSMVGGEIRRGEQVIKNRTDEENWLSIVFHSDMPVIAIQYSEQVKRASTNTTSFKVTMSTQEIATEIQQPVTPIEFLRNVKIVMDLHLLSRDDFYTDENLMKFFGNAKIVRREVFGSNPESKFIGIVGIKSMAQATLSSLRGIEWFDLNIEKVVTQNKPTNYILDFRSNVDLHGVFPELKTMERIFGEDWDADFTEFVHGGGEWGSLITRDDGGFHSETFMVFGTDGYLQSFGFSEKQREEGQCRHYDTARPVTPLSPCATVGTDPAALDPAALCCSEF